MRNILINFLFLLSASVLLSQNQDCGIIAPNLFDTVEDEYGATKVIWTIELPCKAEKISVQLFNRWGETLIEKEEWDIEENLEVDGTEIKSQMLFYKISLHLKGEEIEYQGSVKR